MAEQRIIFPDDHPYHPGKSLVIPENATQEQVDEVIKSLSQPPEQQQQPSEWADVAKSVGVAPAKAAIGMAGLPGDAMRGINTLSNWTTKKALDWGLTDQASVDARNQKYREKYGALPGESYPLPGSADIRKSVEENVTGPIYEPKTTKGKFAGAAAEGALGGLAGPGGLVSKLGLYGALPGVLSEGAGQLAQKYAPSKEGIARLGASLFGPMAARKAITPRTLDNPERMQQYKSVVAESGGKFKPTTGQLFEDQAQINRELAARPNINQEQKDALMETVTKHAGDPTTRITSGKPDAWVNRNLDRTGSVLDNLQQSTYIQPRGNQLLRNGRQNYSFPDVVNTEMSRPQDTNKILGTIGDTFDHMRPHQTAIDGEKLHSALFGANGRRPITGEQYRRLRTNLHQEAENSTSNETAHSYRQVANALDKGMGQTDPQFLKGWQDARREYAHTLVGQELAGKKLGTTQFTADQIAKATQKVMGKKPFLRGELESSPFLTDAAGFAPLKQGKVPEKYPAYQSIPIAGPLMGHAVNNAPWLMGVGGTLGSLGLGSGFGTALETGVLGTLLAHPQLGNKVRSMVDPMNPVLQGYQKNQLAPLRPGDYNDRMRSMLMRGAIEQGNQNQQPQNY